MVLAVCSISVCEARPLRHQLGMSEATASWTWQTVTWGFFFPQLFSDTRQEQVAYTRQDQVTLESAVVSAFPLIESDLLFLILKAPFDTPSPEGSIGSENSKNYGKSASFSKT